MKKKVLRKGTGERMGREEKKWNNPKKSLRRSRSAVKGTGKMGRREKGVQEASKISWRVSLETVRHNRNAETPVGPGVCRG